MRNPKTKYYVHKYNNHYWVQKSGNNWFFLNKMTGKFQRVTGFSKTGVKQFLNKLTADEFKQDIFLDVL